MNFPIFRSMRWLRGHRPEGARAVFLLRHLRWCGLYRHVMACAPPSVGDEVVLIGEQDKAEIAVEELAEKTGTIPYEVLARIHPFLPRVVS